MRFDICYCIFSSLLVTGRQSHIISLVALKTVNGCEVNKLKYCLLLLPKELYSQEQDHKSH